jgi:hypothetical protein
VAVLSLSLLYIVAGIASLPHPVISYSVIPPLSVILRERSDRRISLRAGSAKNLVFEKLGMMGIDALHIACAEKANNPSLSLALKDLLISTRKEQILKLWF